MTINILHTLLSTGTVAAKAGMEEVLLGGLEGSKACMVNHIKGMGQIHRQAMTSTLPLLRTRVLSHSNTHHLVEKAPILEVSATMGVPGRHSHPRTLSNIPALVLATILACLMFLGVLSQPIRGRIRGLALTWANRAVTTIRFAAMAIHPRCLVVPVLP